MTGLIVAMLRRRLAVAALAGVVAAVPACAWAGAPVATIARAIAIRDHTVPRAQRVLDVAHESQVLIEWSADRPTTVHLEGYDISVVVRPGQPSVMQFKAYATGRFAVHAHDGERRDAAAAHGHGRSALLWLEVHPK